MKSTASIRKKRKVLALKKEKPEDAYRRLFVPTPSPLWQRDDDNYSLEQPSPLKWEPSETTYGIDVLLPLPNA